MQLDSNKNKMKESILYVAILLFIELFIYFIPIVIIPLIFFAPPIVALMYLRWNKRNIVISLAIIALLIFFASNFLYTLSISSTIIPSGLILGYCLKKYKKQSQVILYLSIAVFISSIISIIAAALINGAGINGLYNYLNSTVGSIKSLVNDTKTTYISLGMSSTQLEAWDTILKFITTDKILKAIPGFIVVISFLYGVVAYFISTSILSGQKYNMRKGEPFSIFYIDNRIGATVTIILCLGMILTLKDILIGDYLLSFIEMVASIIFSIQGLAVSYYIFHTKLKLHKVAIVITFILMFFIQLQMVFIIVGFMDTILDTRKVDPNRIFKK